VKITKEELANIIKEEVEKALEEKMSSKDYEEWASENGMELKIVLDKEDNMISVPVSRPRLPYNWADMPSSSPERYWARMWFRHHKKPAEGDASVDKRKGEPSASKKASGNLPGEEKSKYFEVPRSSTKKAKKVKDLGLKPGTGKGLSTKKDAMAALGYNTDGIPSTSKKTDTPFPGSSRFRDRSKPFKLKKEPRGPQKSSGVPSKPVLKGRPILVNKAGKRTSLKTKDSQWKFRDGTLVPIYNYIRGRGRVEDEKGLKYYGLSLDEQVADFPSFADWWQGDNRKKYPTPSRAKRGYSIARSRAVSQTQNNLQKAADDLKDDQ
jgi:hypothetical protein